MSAVKEPNNRNVPAEGIPYFTSAQTPPAGTYVGNDAQSPASLFRPLKIRGVEFQNRIFLSPLCQYSADNGHLTAWHMAHLGGIFTRGTGLAFVEATAVVPEGRITPQCPGLWSDDLIPSFAKVVEFAHSQNQKIAIQLAHAGRKASTVAPWITGDELASEAVGGWPDRVFGPSDIPFSSTYPKPKALTKEGIQHVVRSFGEAAVRAVKAGFDVIEIHNAHGYLLDSFLSPISNKRTDEYGGSFENRVRLTLEVVDHVRSVIPEDMPLFLRISATDWLEEVFPNEPSWRSEDTVRLAPILFEHGVDFLDVSTGGNHPAQKVVTGGAYQARFAEDVKKAIDKTPGDRRLIVGSVGGITTGKLAQDILDTGKADAVLVGRQFIKNPGSVWAWAEELGVDIRYANQMRWPFKGRHRK